MNKVKCSKCGEMRAKPGFSTCYACSHPDATRYDESVFTPENDGFEKCVADLIKEGASADAVKAQYWKQYEKKLIALAHDMNRALERVNATQRVPIPSDPESGWQIKIRQEAYLNSRLADTTIGPSVNPAAHVADATLNIGQRTGGVVDGVIYNAHGQAITDPRIYKAARELAQRLREKAQA